MSRERRSEIPWDVDVRPDTGLYNARLGIWLFLAADLMFFGALVSSYVLLRTGADPWPAVVEIVDLPRALSMTALLVASAATLMHGFRALEARRPKGFRLWTGATVLLGLAFLALGLGEWSALLGKGSLPSTGTFLAIWFTLTGVHALHLAAGLAVVLWILGPGFPLWRREPIRYLHRLEVAGLYWHFVTLVWLVLLVVVYLS